MASLPAARRRGTVVHEAAIAMILVAAILTSVVQILAISARQSRARHLRLTATGEAGNLMEQLMARSWEQLTPEAVAAIQLSADCQTILPDPRLKIEITPSDDISGGRAKQLAIEIAWRDASGSDAAPIHLVAWKYPRPETDP